jgi:hypothetical protein
MMHYDDCSVAERLEIERIKTKYRKKKKKFEHKKDH